MQAPVRFTRLAIALHWLLAAALLYQLVLGWWMVDLPKSPPGLRAGWFNWHKSVGLLVGITVLVRLGWRLSHPMPEHAALPRWQAAAARASHLLLYACMLVLPLSGYLGSSFSGYPVRFFGIVLPAWSGSWPVGKSFMSDLHLATVWIFMTLVAVHVCAAVWHWGRGDGVAARMGLPRLRKETAA